MQSFLGVYTECIPDVSKYVSGLMWLSYIEIQWNLFCEATPLERPLEYENLNLNVLISTPDKRPPLLKGKFSGPKQVASQEGFYCI